MAEVLYGSVTFHGGFVGTLREEPGGRFSFTYHSDYLEAGGSAIAYTLPLGVEPIYSLGGLHPFFDNLVAEGWLANAQARALGIPSNNRFRRLLAFGHDCIGAASVLDPKPRGIPKLDAGTPEEIAALASRASLSGVQPKLLAVKTPHGYRPANSKETSTYIAKLPSTQPAGIVELEYLTTVAAAALLPDDRFAEMEVADVAGVRGPCLLVRRFDRAANGDKIHFEEFNQLLNHEAEAKYEGAYSDMAAFMRENPRCEASGIDTLFRRVLVSILLGNNDAHLKNFGLLYAEAALQLAPGYDMVAAALYPEFDSAPALRLGPGTNPRRMSEVGSKHVQVLAKSFGLGLGAMRQAVQDLGARLDPAEAAVREAGSGRPMQKKRLAEFMRKRWNATFRSIGPR